MEQINSSVIEALKASTSLKITIDGEIEIILDEPNIGKSIANGLRQFYETKNRQSQRRKTLSEAIGTKDSSAKALQKWLVNGFNVKDWSELDDVTLVDFKEYISGQKLSTSTIKKYLGRLALIIKTYRKAMDIPSEEYASILKCNNDTVKNTYLTERELWAFENTEAKTKKEKIVKAQFLTGCYTGARFSDVSQFTSSNINGSVLTYTSKKTHTFTQVPLKPAVKKWIEFLSENRTPITPMGFNVALRRLCQRAGINENVGVRRGSKDLTGEKWRFISSHSARRTFATLLSEKGTPIYDIAKLAGHSDVKVTGHYICKDTVNLSSMALQYFE